MTDKKSIQVLVVDDSPVFRELLSRGISSDPLIRVAAAAADPFEARDRILQYQPDVMTCDVEMPHMNGIEFIRRLLPQYPLPVIVVSSVNDMVFDAMQAGAVDFVAKPDARSVKSVEAFIRELIAKIKIASVARVKETGLCTAVPGPAVNAGKSPEEDRIIAIGASTGGTEALYHLLSPLPRDIPGIVVVQHMPPVFTEMFAQRLDHSLALRVKEARTGDFVERGQVLIAPGDRHMTVKKTGGGYRVECSAGERVNGHCPSVDVLFESVARQAGHKAVGIILTGMGYDGARGLLAMKRKGARTLGQDEKSCVVYGMPRVAFELGAVEKQASPENLPAVLCALLK